METNNTVSPEVYKLLESADWDSLGQRMLARAIWRGRNRYGIVTSTLLAKGLSIEDIPSYIIQSVFEGKRKWNPEVDLETWLLNHVDSVLDWLLNLRENRDAPYNEADSVEQENEGDEEYSQIQSTELEIVLQYGPPTPEEIVLEHLQESEATELYNALYDDVADTPELQELLLAMMDANEAKPGIIAVLLNIPIEEAYTRRRRLKRHLERVFGKMKKASYEKEK